MLPYEMSNISDHRYIQLYRLQKPTFLLSVWEMSYKGSRHIGYHSQYSISDGSRFILARLFVWLLVLQQIFNHWSLSMSGLTGDSQLERTVVCFTFGDWDDQMTELFNIQSHVQRTLWSSLLMLCIWKCKSLVKFEMSYFLSHWLLIERSAIDYRDK